MKILIVSTYDVKGGAGRAALRLHEALLKNGVDSVMLVQHKHSNDAGVFGLKPVEELSFKMNNYVAKRAISKYKRTTKGLFSNTLRRGFSSMVARINSYEADIVHLHWTCHGMLGIEDIPQIKAPVVWSLHDMWAFTGGCHYDLECNLYKSTCSHCKVLGSTASPDISTRLQKRKINAFGRKKSLTVVGLSEWIAGCSQSSTILGNKKTVVLPNPIDLSIYKPVEKAVARRILNLPSDGKLILFGAMDSTKDPRKGFTELLQALQLLQTPGSEVVILGSNKPAELPDFKQPFHYLGQVQDEISLAVIYSACDLMVVPSLQENLSNTIMESLACGMPIVAFDIGGNKDLISHKVNGYLSKQQDAVDLARGIDWVLTHPDPVLLAAKAREKVEQSYEQNKVARQYIRLYASILE